MVRTLDEYLAVMGAGIPNCPSEPPNHRPSALSLFPAWLGFMFLFYGFGQTSQLINHLRSLRSWLFALLLHFIQIFLVNKHRCL